MAMAKTLAEKVWDAHVVRKGDGDGANAQPDLLFIDLHLVHEVTSPQAFEGLRLAGRPVRRPDLTIATEDHNTPTLDIDRPIADTTKIGRAHVELQSRQYLVCRLLLEKKKTHTHHEQDDKPQHPQTYPTHND